MPKYEVTGPDGRRYEIDAPNPTVLEEAIGQMFGGSAPAPAPPVTTALTPQQAPTPAIISPGGSLGDGFLGNFAASITSSLENQARGEKLHEAAYGTDPNAYRNVQRPSATSMSQTPGYTDKSYIDRLTGGMASAGDLAGEVVGGSLGPLLGAMAGGGVGSKVLGTLGAAVGAFTGGGQLSGDQAGAQRYEEARLAGYDHEAAQAMAANAELFSTMIGGASFAVPAFRLTPRLAIGSGATAGQVAKNVGREFVAQAAAQTALGPLEQLSQNVTARTSGLRPDQSLTEGLLDAAVGEALFSVADVPGIRGAIAEGQARVKPELPPSPPSPTVEKFQYDVGDTFSFSNQDGTLSKASIVGVDPDTNRVQLALPDGNTIQKDMADVNNPSLFAHQGKDTTPIDNSRAQAPIDATSWEEEQAIINEAETKRQQQIRTNREIKELKQLAKPRQMDLGTGYMATVDRAYDEAIERGNMDKAADIDNRRGVLMADLARADGNRLREKLASPAIATKLEPTEIKSIGDAIAEYDKLAKSYEAMKPVVRAPAPVEAQLPQQAAPRAPAANPRVDSLAEDISAIRDSDKALAAIYSKYNQRVGTAQANKKLVGNPIAMKKELANAKKARDEALREFSPSEAQFTQASEGQSLIDFLLDKGGIVEVSENGAPSGELEQYSKPIKTAKYGSVGKRLYKVVRSAFDGRGKRVSGLSPDEAARYAQEAGYIKNHDINELLEALDKDYRAITYPNDSRQSRVFSQRNKIQTPKDRAVIDRYERQSRLDALKEDIYKAFKMTSAEIQAMPPRQLAAMLDEHHRVIDSETQYGADVDGYNSASDADIDGMNDDIFADSGYAKAQEEALSREPYYEDTQEPDQTADAGGEAGGEPQVQQGARPQAQARSDDAGKTYERGAEGYEQGVIEGAEREADRLVAERKMAQPLRSDAKQKPADEGLFDTGARDQMDLDPDGNPWFALEAELRSGPLLPDHMFKKSEVEPSHKDYHLYSRAFNNPVHLKDGARLSGVTNPGPQTVFYGYDKNGENFTIQRDRVNPEDIVSSRDGNKTADRIKERLEALRRYAFAGPASADANLGNLSQAKQRLDAGEDANTVREETGWFRGDDGKWRYEISDKDAKIKGNVDDMFADDNEVIGETTRLADILDHPKLFAAYPDLSDMEVSVRRTQDSGYNDKSGRIILGTLGTTTDGLAGRLLHEVQHFIQRREGFAIGSNERRAGSRDAYKRSAGEIEARNVQARKTMTEEQRKFAGPEITRDVPAGDAIVEFSDGTTANAPDALTSQYTPAAAKAMNEIQQEVIDTVRRIAGNTVGLETPTVIGTKGNARIRGTYFANSIKVALGLGDPVGAGRHEAAHFLEDVGAIPKPMLVLLRNMAEKRWIKDYNIDATYGDASPEVKQAEAWVAAYEAWARGDYHPVGAVRKAFFKIKNFFDAIMNALSGRGFITPESIFRNIEAGKYAVNEGKNVAVSGLNIEFNTDKDAAEFAANRAVDEMGREAGARAEQAFVDDQINYALENGKDPLPTDRVAKAAKIAREAAATTDTAKYVMLPFTSYLRLPRTIARMSPEFSNVYHLISKYRDSARSIINMAHDVVHPLKLLPAKKIPEFNRLVDAYKVNGQQVPYAPGAVVIEVDKGATRKFGPDSLVKPGETVRVTDPQIKDAFFAYQRTMKAMNDRFVSNLVYRYTGYDGPINREAITAAARAITDPVKRAKMQKVLNVIDEIMETSTKSGYVPSMRYGDYYVSVKQRDPGTGTIQTVYRTHVPVGSLAALTPGRTKKTLDTTLDELRKYYDPAKGYTFDVNEVTKDTASNLDLDLIEQMALQMQGAQSAETLKAIDVIIEQMFNKRVSAWRRRSNDIPGYDKDFVKVALDYVHQAAGTIERVRFLDDISQAASITEKMPSENSHSNAIKQFSKDWMAWMDSPTNPLQSLKTYSFLYHMGLSPKSALVQFFSTPLTIMANGPLIFGVNNTVSRMLPEIQKTIRNVDFDTKEGLLLENERMARNEDERRAIRRATRDGFLGATLSRFMSGLNFSESVGSSAKRAYNDAVNIASSGITVAEQTQKVAVFTSAYRIAKEQPDLVAKNLAKNYKNDLIAQKVLSEAGKPDFAYQVARFAVDELMLQTNQENTPKVMRGYGSIPTQFMKYPYNLLSNIADLSLRRGAAGKMSATYMAMLLWMVAGAMGMPFAEDMEDFASWAAEKFFKRNINFDMESRNIIDSMSGIPGTGEMVMRGPLRNTGVDIAASLGMGNMLPSARVSELFGAPLAAVEPILNIATALAGAAGNQQKYEGAADTIMQNFPVKGVRDLYTGAVAYPREGVVRGSGGNTVMPSEITSTDAALKAIGVTPTSVTRAREQQYYLGQVRNDYYSQRDRAYYGMVNSIALMLDYKKSGNTDAAAAEEQNIRRMASEYASVTGEAPDTRRAQTDAMSASNRIGIARLKALNEPLLLRDLIENPALEMGDKNAR